MLQTACCGLGQDSLFILESAFLARDEGDCCSHVTRTLPVDINMPSLQEHSRRVGPAVSQTRA